MNLNEKQKEWVKQLEDLWEYFDKRLGNGYDLKTSELKKVLLLHMMGGVHRVIRGFIAQIKGGSNDDLEGKLRTLVEATINIEYIFTEESDNRAKAFVINGTKSRLAAVSRILSLLEKNKAPSMAEVTDIDKYGKLKKSLGEELAKQEKILGKENARWPNIEQRAKLGNTEEAYATAFWLFSEDSHMTAEGLNRFLQDDGEKTIMTTHMDETRFDHQIRTAYLSYIAFINTCSEKLGFPPKEEFIEYNKSEMLPH